MTTSIGIIIIIIILIIIIIIIINSVWLSKLDSACLQENTVA